MPSLLAVPRLLLTGQDGLGRTQSVPPQARHEELAQRLAEKVFFKFNSSPGQCELAGALSHRPKGCGFDSPSGHIASCGFDPPLGHVRKGKQSMFFSHISVSVSPFPSL